MSGLERVRLHVKNNRAGEAVFRITEQRLAEAAARWPGVAARVDTLVDFDLDRFDESMATAHALVTWDLPTAAPGRRSAGPRSPGHGTCRPPAWRGAPRRCAGSTSSAPGSSTCGRWTGCRPA